MLIFISICFNIAQNNYLKKAMKKFLLYSLVALFASCSGGQVENKEVTIPQSNIYEVNIRQYTQEQQFALQIVT